MTFEPAQSQPAGRTPTGRHGRKPRLMTALPAVFLAAALAACAPASPARQTAASGASASSADASSHATSAQAELPRPTGRHAVGRATLHLVDKNRPDPWVPTAGPRQLMVSMYYPARPRTGGPAPYMTTEEARLLLQRKAPNSTIPPETISRIRTYAHTDARPTHGRFPLVVLSPGLTLPRAVLSGLAEDLASRGYVVALVDHTYEAAGITFPDGKTLACVICDRPPAGGPPAIAESRARDITFVIDQLTGPHPAWRSARMIDTRHIGVAGHSISGDAAPLAMAADDRVRAGVNLDGTFYAPVPATGLHGRPFLLLGTQSIHSSGSDKDTTWDRDWPKLDGWKRWPAVAGADHSSFTDGPVLETMLGMPIELSAQRSLAITRAYVGAFFDLHFKGRHRVLLDGPTAANPEVTFQHP
ncbi:lipase [Actinoallomurus vinaceus]|uniref:Lipase n=1 Tax=Actinoallomurus vinaceus TaxID=1080074 RepID=A0ABP8UQM4_9ACTN